jgi:hypothetical protein
MKVLLNAKLRLDLKNFQLAFLSKKKKTTISSEKQAFQEKFAAELAGPQRGRTAPTLRTRKEKVS